MKWSSEQRDGFLNELNTAENIVVTFYRLLLGLIIGAVLGVVILVVKWRPWGAGSQGEWFYFSIGVLLVLGWAVGQLIALGRRQRRQRPLDSSPSGLSASIGTVEFGISQRFDTPLASLPARILPDKQTLARFGTELQKDLDIDDVCRLIEPACDNKNDISTFTSGATERASK
jgi:hypothetical protein